jgi:hypothetical protein
LTLRLVNNIGTENKKNCEAKRIFHYTSAFVHNFSGEVAKSGAFNHKYLTTLEVFTGVKQTSGWFVEQKLMLSSSFWCCQIHNCH